MHNDSAMSYARTRFPHSWLFLGFWAAIESEAGIQFCGGISGKQRVLAIKMQICRKLILHKPGPLLYVYALYVYLIFKQHNGSTRGGVDWQAIIMLYFIDASLP